MGMRGAENMGVQRIRKRKVIDKTSTTGEQAIVF